MARRYYYECVYDTGNALDSHVDIGYWAPDPRKERDRQAKGGFRIQNPRVQHVIRLRGTGQRTDARGNPMRPDYIVTDRPVGRSYTEEITKTVQRPVMNRLTGQLTHKPIVKVSKIKLRLLGLDEIDFVVKDTAYDLDWNETLFDNDNKNVTLPKGVRELIVADQDIMDPEDRPKSSDEPEPVRKKKVRRKRAT